MNTIFPEKYKRVITAFNRSIDEWFEPKPPTKSKRVTRRRAPDGGLKVTRERLDNNQLNTLIDDLTSKVKLELHVITQNHKTMRVMALKYGHAFSNQPEILLADFPLGVHRKTVKKKLENLMATLLTKDFIL